ncbi:MAG TPA: c-type cytochrome [Longimicrobiaceae bacterium]|nr:c-type cytochrome [Longimicrobiaceae bacterium]
MTRRAYSNIAGLLILFCALTACGSEDLDDSKTPAEPPPESTPVDPRIASSLPEGATIEMAIEGERLFVVCAVCHGSDAMGTQLGPALTDSLWIHGSGSLEEITAIVRAGIGDPEEFPIPMPVMGAGDFNAEQLRAVSAYVYALSHAPS